MLVLNVGGGGSRTLPSNYDGWEQHLLDIDPAVKPDICCDAVEITEKLPPGCYDAVYCSHNLEHLYQHDVPKVLGGFLHVLRPGGAVEIHVPNFQECIRAMNERGLDLNDVWYRLPDGTPITYHDTLFGWGAAMRAGNLYYAHRCAFTLLSLGAALTHAGFAAVSVTAQGGNLKGTGLA